MDLQSNERTITDEMLDHIPKVALSSIKELNSGGNSNEETGVSKISELFPWVLTRNIIFSQFFINSTAKDSVNKYS